VRLAVEVAIGADAGDAAFGANIFKAAFAKRLRRTTDHTAGLVSSGTALARI